MFITCLFISPSLAFKMSSHLFIHLISSFIKTLQILVSQFWKILYSEFSIQLHLLFQVYFLLSNTTFLFLNTSVFQSHYMLIFSVSTSVVYFSGIPLLLQSLVQKLLQFQSHRYLKFFKASCQAHETIQTSIHIKLLLLSFISS